ncbi:MAG: radical SAM protein [Desulfobacterales bacterium]|nr:radical SAM protein [Desulfobacterales bacterium]
MGLKHHRVLLVNPPHSGFLGMGFEPSISLGYLSETLESHGVDHEVLDMALGYDENHLRATISRLGPDLVGFTMTTLDYAEIIRLIRGVKREFGVEVVVGGPHVSCAREELLEECPEIDRGVVMEGEQTLMELVSGKPPRDVPGLLFRTEAGVVFTGERPFARDLDAAPFPRYRKFEMGKYLKRSVGVVTSRGCPHQCIYCPVRLTSGNRMRLRSAESVFEEISYWHGRGWRAIDIWDDNFSISRKRVHAICDRIIREKTAPLVLNLPNGVRADRVNRAMLEKMKAAGFRKIAFGVEGGNDRILRLLRKGERMETIERAIEDACDVGLDVILFFLIGTPGETMEDVEDSFRLALRHPVAGANFYNLIPFPRTELFDLVSGKGWLLKEPGEYLNGASQFANEPCFYTPELSALERKRAFRRAARVSRQVKGAWAGRKFRRLGPLAEIIRLIYTNERLTRLYSGKRSVYRIIETLKQRLLRER